MAWTLITLLRRYMIKTLRWEAQRGKGRDGIGDGRAPSDRARAGDPRSTALLSLGSLPRFGAPTMAAPSWRLQAGFGQPRSLQPSGGSQKIFAITLNARLLRVLFLASLRSLLLACGLPGVGIGGGGR